MAAPKCHPDRKYRALGLCDPCYSKLKRERRGKKNRQSGRCPDPDKVARIMASWEDSLNDVGNMRRVLEGIFGKYNPAISQELL